MAKSKNQKLKILYIVDALRQNTDAEHGMTLSEIISYLEDCGVEAERKSLYDDISLLCEVYGLDIQKVKVNKRTEYRLFSHDYDIHELKLLADAVAFSRFITEKKSDELILKLKKECSRYDAEKLSRQMIVCGKIKNMNECIYYTVDSIFEAISRERTVRFRLYHLDGDKNKIYRNGGEYYEVSPYTLVYNSDNYYLIGYDFLAKKIKNFRVDRIEDLSVGEKYRDEKKYFSDIDAAQYTDAMFGMFGGEPLRVRIEFSERLVSAVFDRFGTGIIMQKNQRGLYECSVSVCVSEQFFGWICGFGGEMKVLTPTDVQTEYVSFLEKNLAFARS